MTLAEAKKHLQAWVDVERMMNAGRAGLHGDAIKVVLKELEKVQSS